MFKGKFNKFVFQSKAKKYFLELITSETKPKDIARGVALGIFIGFIPVWGVLQFFIAVFFSSILKVNKIATVLGTVVTTPLTIPFIYSFCYKVGVWLLKLEVQAFSFKDITFSGILAIAKPLLVGSIFVGLIAAIIAYILTYFIVWKIYSKRKTQTPTYKFN